MILTLIISLPGENQRLEFQYQQAKRLGLNIEIIDAISVQTLSPSADDPCWQRWQRPLRDVEKALLQSHCKAWRRVITLDQPALILENDAWLSPQATDTIQQAVSLQGIEHLSLETRGRKKLLGSAHPQLPSLRRLWLDRSGAAAYLCWPSAACKFLARADAVPALSDAVLVETPNIARWQAFPALAIQVDMAQHYGIHPPFTTKSMMLSEDYPKHRDLRFLTRRIARQLLMGIMMLRPGSKLIEPKPDEYLEEL